jgi:hypothetical protein
MQNLEARAASLSRPLRSLDLIGAAACELMSSQNAPGILSIPEAKDRLGANAKPLLLACFNAQRLLVRKESKLVLHFRELSEEVILRIDRRWVHRAFEIK